jgi:hypothetical protein
MEGVVREFSSRNPPTNGKHWSPNSKLKSNGLKITQTKLASFVLDKNEKAYKN